MRKGQYYKMQYKGEDYYWILHYAGKRGLHVLYYTCMTSKGQYYGDGGIAGKPWGSMSNFTQEKASKEDVSWLQQCIEACKWIEKLKMEYYEIY